MSEVNGHYDGRVVVLDGPVPGDWQPNMPVKIVAVGEPAVQPHSLAQMAKLAQPGKMPPDFSEQHDLYLYGTPKR